MKKSLIGTWLLTGLTLFWLSGCSSAPASSDTSSSAAVSSTVSSTAVSSLSSGSSAPASSSSAAPLSTATNRVAIIGDSISASINPDFSTTLSTYGWVNMLAGETNPTNLTSQSTNIGNLWPGTNGFLSNFAVSGSTAADWNNSTWIDPVISNQPNIAVVFIGGNDFLADYSDGLLSTAEKTALSNNVTGIVKKLKTGLPQIKILIVGYYDLFDTKSQALGLFPTYANYSNMSAGTVECNVALSNIALAEGCDYAENYATFMHHCYGGSLGDTGHLSPDFVRTPITSLDIHPVTAGHLSIYQTIAAKLRQM